MKAKIFAIQLLLQATFHSHAQEIAGTVTDSRKEPIANATVRVMQSGIVKGETVTDFDGNYVVKPLDPGRYDVTASDMGKQTLTFTGVPVNPGNRTSCNFSLVTRANASGIPATVKPYKKPLIDTNHRMVLPLGVGQDEILPTPPVADLVASAPSVYQSKRGDPSYSTPRAPTNVYVIDGIRVQDTAQVKKRPKFHLWPFRHRGSN